ncbi:MAG: cytochrome P460 family protein [Myxococcota bacterium]
MRLSFVVLGLAACGGDKTTTESGETGTMPMTTPVAASDEEIAAELWADIDGYESWTVPPGWSTTPTLSSMHMGGYVVTWFDDTLAAWDFAGSAPEGSIAVKRATTDESGATVADITVMQKRAGYDAANGDWFYAQFGADGTVMAAGAIAMCVGCHADAPTDFLYADPPAM